MQKKNLCVQKVESIGIRASSTLAWYKNGKRKNDEVMHNFEHGCVPVGGIEA